MEILCTFLLFCATFLLFLATFPFTLSAEIFQAWNLDELVHPDLKHYLHMMPSFDMTLDKLAFVREFAVPKPESIPKDDSVDVRNETLSSGLRVRVYTPKTEQKDLPAMLWIHGGGHMHGIPEMDEFLLLTFAKEIGCIVVAPDYRLSPENPYPADLEDCYEALVWMTENLPIRKDRVAVIGGSAGGGIAAALTLMARDKKGPAIHYQVLFYSQLDYRMDTPSSHQITDKRVPGRNIALLSWKCYLGGLSGDVPVYASPAMEQDLSGLPPAYVMTGELDPFRDETITYAQRLMAAKVPVELHVVPGAYHAFDALQDAPISIKARNEYINAIKEALK